LVIKKPDQDCVTISRLPMEATEESVEEMHNTDWNELSEYRHIHVWELKKYSLSAFWLFFYTTFDDAHKKSPLFVMQFFLMIIIMFD
jgi:DMSO reductase anchor subunit